MINIMVAYATLETQVEIPLTVEENCTVQLAIQRSRVLESFPEIQLQTAVVGIFGLRVKLDSSLKANDRIEIYRPLVIDPKEARRLRA
ncbi:MAG: RnfH family protein [Gammaproteobacteria bacterium RIFCSPLOWO2_02_FULL_42_14]|nr:MAG: RnfH family protein [Gammaproteobacteria bacterium RIFCSPHIGHO2_02_FULL_42_43]OGT28074.1 MAG: RnfH family protein [Gammaproteobacteria bacterium RIFCSPHIGHO2_01_FULL_42_8]OGT52562.1 MAG: RnfH family protein [Gammaproteobacteria bacterium RIFCSPHIGHO2_12_FULL_41_25]OGT63160.1 MAG: RnfH family protein [Gammaproteobacteria bacterium RIFCSPLOWO2_02_FULL_42_14]OGT86660.1 MAG: RnfH family protein [Gammaproteobacteria bacterium RIFCSPLOWO2_12_FULL_42_18]